METQSTTVTMSNITGVCGDQAADPAAAGDEALNGSNKWVYGVIAWVFACFLAAAGVLLQKYAHNREEAKVASLRSPWYKQPVWWLGFFMLVILPLPMNMAAMGLAPQSLLAPLQSCSLVFNAILASRFMGEKLTQVDLISTGLMIVGASITTAFGNHCDPGP